MKILPDLFSTFAKIGTFTFGGGYAMISLIDHECVEKKKWMTPEELMDMTVIAESTPGPIATNCATYAGYKKAGMIGAIVATFGMTLPSFLIILLISTVCENLLGYPIVANAFKGMRVAVAVLIVQAAVKMIKNMLKSTKNEESKKNRYVSIGFIFTFFTVVLMLNFLQIHFSTIYLIIIAGILGFAIYSIPKKEENK